ncbi:MAG: 30S ribosomal protein S7 [Candidatus Cloacimonadota bacterium]|nr:MAG: 30S ribosomal protein S7 [Candidatus Cloacimonadota bacterium]
MRRRRAEKREILPDPKFKSVLASKFINMLMKNGKKTISERIFYNALDIIKKKTNDDPIEVFKKAIENVKPVVEVRSRRIGGQSYQVPVEVRPSRKLTLAYRWIIDYARQRPERVMEERLANELMSAYNKEGASIKKREDVHRMAKANQAFAHFKW